MQGQDIAEQLARVLPKYTSGFSDAVNVVAATVVGTTVSITTDVAHNLDNGENASIDSLQAPVQIDASSFLRTGTTAIFDTLQQHDLTLSQRDIANGGKTITISGANEAQFNGTFQMLADKNRNSLTIAVDDSGPTTISGAPLVNDANGGIFNGLFPVANVAATTFDYTLPQAYALDPVVNGAQVQVSIRIISVLDIVQYLDDVYTSKEVGKDVLVVQLGDVVASKNRSEETDAAMSNSGTYAFNNIMIQPFALYVVQNTTDQIAASAARDKIEREYVPAVFHAVLRAQFDTGFDNSDFRSTFTGHGVFAYSSENGKNKALYAHEISFEQLVQITGADTVAPDDTVAMRDVSFDLTTNLGTGGLTANVNLDEDAEPEP